MAEHTRLEKLNLEPHILRELRSQHVESVEDLLILASQPDERDALLQDMRWNEPRLESILDAARRLVQPARAAAQAQRLRAAAAAAAAAQHR